MLRDLLSVVIFSHERFSQLEVATRSVLEADSDCAILIVDDASQSLEMLRGLARLEQHERISVYRRRTLLRRWNQRGGFYSNIRFALHEVQTPFALLMEDDQQIVRPFDRAEFEQIADCLHALKSPFMGVTFAHNKDARLPSVGASNEDLFVKSAQAAYSTNALVHLARVREHRFRIGPSAQATDVAAAAYFGPHPVWPAPFLAYRPGDHGFRFGRAVGRPQAGEDANHSSYVTLAAPEIARLKLMFPEVPTVAEFLSTRGSAELPTSASLGGTKGKKPLLRRLWYFLTTRSYMAKMRLRRLVLRKVGDELTVLPTATKPPLENPIWLSAAKAVYTQAPPARRLVFRHVAERLISAHDDLAAQWGVLHHAEFRTVAQQHDVSTTYVLGSGYSINEYSDAMFGQIRLGWSVALNRWSEHHSFAPDSLLIESLSRWDSLMRRKPNSRPSSVFVTRFPSIERSANKRLDSDSGDLRDILKHYVALPMLGLTPSSYADYVDDLLSLSDGFPHVVGPNRTSIERAVVIAAIAGAHEVVLCGTDLQGPHFWQSPPDGPVRRHGTDTGKAFRRRVARRLPVLAEVLHSRLGTTVTLGLERGPLAGVLPVHMWESGCSPQSEPQRTLS